MNLACLIMNNDEGEDKVDHDGIDVDLLCSEET
jgi:hypothetical protein